MAHQRIEDLGKIAVLTEGLLEHDIFSLYYGRAKDCMEWYASISEDAKKKFVSDVIYYLQDIEERLNKISEIALGQDYLNQDEQK